MTFQRQVLFWSAAAVLLLVFLIVFSSILLPFVAGMALAYLLDPVADWLERVGMGRLAATITILIATVLILLLLFLTLVPILANQMAAFLENLPSYAEGLSALAEPLIHSRLAQLLDIDPASVGTTLRGVLSQGAGSITTVLLSIWSGGRAILNIVALFVVTPVVAFYLLYDWDRMVARVDEWVPRDHLDTVRDLARQCDEAIAGFMRGQVLVILILGTFYAIGLAMIGLNFGIFIGFSAGVLSFIPYVGSTVGFLVAITVALVQFWPEWGWVAATAAIFFAGQFLEGNFLQPYLVGQSVGLHPVWLMFALFAFGLLFGFVGLLLAVPAAAIVAVLARFALGRYMQSPYYLGAARARDEGPSAE